MELIKLGVPAHVCRCCSQLKNLGSIFILAEACILSGAAAAPVSGLILTNLQGPHCLSLGLLQDSVPPREQLSTNSHATCQDFCGALLMLDTVCLMLGDPCDH